MAAEKFLPEPGGGRPLRIDVRAAGWAFVPGADREEGAALAARTSLLRGLDPAP